MQHVRFDLSAGTFHALATEPAAASSRPLLFLHGFPDHPPTAEPFFAELAARGHSVLAPWLRGYQPSPVRRPYHLLTLANDMLELIRAWSPDQPIDVVGHDWGAVVTYSLCLLAPERIARAATLAVPHPRTFVRQLRSPSQLRASWYFGMFQLPGASYLIKRDDFALIDRLWRAWSPNFALPAAERAALHACLEQSMPGPLEYYREARRAGRELLRFYGRSITTPLLALHGLDDGCVMPPTHDDRHYFTSAYERETMAGLGHFMHLEDPDRVATRISRWLHASS